MPGGIILGGRELPCSVPVSQGPRIELDHGARLRVRPIDMIVVHWTGGEGDVYQVHRTLQRRRLGVEFVIDPAGRAWQLCDPLELDAMDCGRRYDPRSIGIEVACYGWRRLASQVPRAGRDRRTYVGRIRWSRRTMAAFRAPQYRALTGLCDALTEHVPSIPRRVCAESRTLSRREAATVAGVVGHYQLSRRKLDPGLEPLQVISDWWGRSG